MKNKGKGGIVSIRISNDEFYRRILILLCKHKSLQLNELSNAIGVDISDITLAVAVLENNGFVHQLNLKETGEQDKVALKEEENCIIGLDLGGTKLYGAISDIAGNILCDQEIKNHGKSGEACFEMLADLIDRLINESNHRGLKLLGMGIDVPGLVQLETGLVINAPAVNMRNFPLKERLVTRFGLPVSIDNDLKQAALGEAWFGEGKNYRDMVLLALGTGIAACNVIDGAPLRGTHFRHGELGWMVPGRDFLGRKYVGFGALETEASGPGIVNRAQNLINRTKPDMLSGELTGETVFEAARRGEEWAEQCVAETVDYLAILVANTMAFYDPGVIILSGGVSRSSDLLIPSIMKLVEGCVLTQPNLIVSTLGYKAGVLGAIINLIQYCPEFTC